MQNDMQYEASYEKFLTDSKHAPSSVVIDRVVPNIDRGRFATKRYLNEEFDITAHLLVHGHDLPKGRVWIRHESEKDSTVYPLKLRWNDEWFASFKPTKLGRYVCRVEACMDRFGTWKSDIKKKAQAGQNVQVDLQSGILLLQKKLSLLTQESDRQIINTALKALQDWAKSSQTPEVPALEKLVDDKKMEAILHVAFDPESTVTLDHEVLFQIEPLLARFSSWYEFFPRSTVVSEGAKSKSLRHGTFKDAEDRLPYIKDLGFNVVYFPPIHPIGRSFRKGKNNSLEALADDVGSPWAIGAIEGGHKSILPELGTMDDFVRLVKKARGMNIEIAMDIAFQCAPDHPYVTEHPEWFKKRPDGSIQYAENPPKKYQDIYPFDFECEQWQALWQELRSVVQFWIDKGVKVFRVDNPHTKPYHFWEWLIGTVRQKHPEVIFLAEAFTKPKIMAYLAKSGFSQSYTYFTWRNVKWEITQYMNELTQTDLKDYFAPNFWPNTPDILHERLQEPSPGVYKQRLVLAATLSSNYGLYGPAYELMDYKPRDKGKEEYLDSEKYQLRQWDLKNPQSLAPFLKKINTIRQDHKALQSNEGFRFHPVDSESLIAYSKTLGDEHIVVVVNLDSHKTHSGRVELPLIDWKIDAHENFEMEDLLTGHLYTWTGWRNFVELTADKPAHIFKLHKKGAKA